MKKGFMIFMVILLSMPVALFADITAIVGTPETRICVGDNPQQLTDTEAYEYRCVIVSGPHDKYYWKSRENLELVRTDGGRYITFFAANGSGYVRIDPIENLYVEHLLLCLWTVTYYGTLEITRE